MDKMFYIALYLLGYQSTELIDIMLKVPKENLISLFKSDTITNQFKYNINLTKLELIDNEVRELKLNEAKLIVEQSRKLGIKIIPYNSKYYPKQLKLIPDPPALIYIKGSYITKSDEKSLGCVGSRKVTNFGATSSNLLVSALTKENFTIISGLASGIDSYCHNACLNNGGKTIAVLAHGLDQIYPKESTDLAEKILVSGGCLISEYPIGTKIEKHRFVKRNRIIAALSQAVIIFESKEKSGSMHTVNYALQYNKKVFCPQPTSDGESIKGLSYLINNHLAQPLKTRNDYRIVVKALGYNLTSNLAQTQSVKNEIFNTFINSNSEINIFDNIKNLEYDKYSSIKTNKETYKLFKQILDENGLTIKEFFNAIILLIVNSYKRG